MDARFFTTESDTTVCVKASNVKIKSSNLLIFLGKGFIKKSILKEAEKNSCKSVASQVIEANNEIDEKMNINTPLGTIKGETQSLKFRNVVV
mgnify:CR=1 FL=1